MKKEEDEVFSLINQKLGIKNSNVFDLDVKKAVGSDYMTTEEYNGFKKKKKKADKAKTDFSFLREFEGEEREELGKRQDGEEIRNEQLKLEEEAKKKLKLYSDSMAAATEKVRKRENFRDVSLK
jgi:hypothetical protein